MTRVLSARYISVLCARFTMRPIRVAVKMNDVRSRLVNDRTIDQRAQLAANRVGGGRTHLGHKHNSEVLCGRDPECCGSGAAPVVFARDTEPAEHGGVEHARKAEA